MCTCLSYFYATVYVHLINIQFCNSKHTSIASTQCNYVQYVKPLDTSPNYTGSSIKECATPTP